MPTQTGLLLTVVLLAGGILGIANLWNYVKHKRRIDSKPDVDLSRVLETHFQGADRNRFYDEWNGLARILKVPPEKLSPDDTIAGWVEFMHLPEVYYEQIETYLRKKGLDPSRIGVNTPISGIVDQLLRKSRP